MLGWAGGKANEGTGPVAGKGMNKAWPACRRHGSVVSASLLLYGMVMVLWARCSSPRVFVLPIGPGVSYAGVAASGMGWVVETVDLRDGLSRHALGTPVEHADWILPLAPDVSGGPHPPFLTPMVFGWPTAAVAWYGNPYQGTCGSIIDGCRAMLRERSSRWRVSRCGVLEDAVMFLGLLACVNVAAFGWCAVRRRACRAS